MPYFALDAGDAAALAAWLWAKSIPAGKPHDSDAAGDVRRGELLFHSLGCLACHEVNGLGGSGLFDGGDLTRTADKHPPDFFARWLADPASVDPDHRMPRFELTGEERTDLASYLASCTTIDGEKDHGARPQRPDDKTSDELIERGRQLAAEHRCGACHALPGPGGATENRLTALRESADWINSCAGAPDAELQRPAYRLTAADRKAVEDSVVSLRAQRPAEQPQLDGRRIVREQNCLACHARGTSTGIATHVAALAATRPEWAARLPALTPPALESVGDKLPDETLAAVIAGRAEPLRPWLDVRMPKFDLSAAERQAVVDYFKQVDRIPTNHDNAADPSAPSGDVLALAGARLVTADGFGCTSCHKIGQTEPVHVALNARGTDLSRIGRRVRRQWFDRWVRDPARIVPRMEMPSIQQPIRGVLNNRLDDQLAAVWHVLSIPDFDPPRPDAVRVVRARNLADPQARAAVLTDVLETADQVFVKPLLVGLPNRHNVLFDLQRAGLAGWWIGDTARQRTRGKSWYWEAAGNDVITVDGTARDISLWIDGAELQPHRPGQFATELDWLEHVPGGVRLAYRLNFGDAAKTHSPAVLTLRETITTAEEKPSDAAAAGFRRLLEVFGAPEHATIRFVALTEGAVKMADDRRSIGLPGGLGTPRVRVVAPQSAHFEIHDGAVFVDVTAAGPTDPVRCEFFYVSAAPLDSFPVAAPPPEPIAPVPLHVVPGFEAHRLPLPDGIMPSGLAWREDGTLLFSSLKGRVWLARDTDGDELEDETAPFSDELAAPYGVAVHGDAVDVICKYGLLRLEDHDHDGHAERTTVLASGWGHTDDYHDWAVGLEKDAAGNYYIALPCQQDDRDRAAAYLRGSAIKISPRTATAEDPRLYDIEPICSGLRFPMGLAVSRAGDLLATDNQGNYNPFNELNQLLPGGHYGFVNKLDVDQPAPPVLTEPAINIPHPWTRSVNGICFLDTPGTGPFFGQKAVFAGKQATENLDLSPSATDGRFFGPWEGHLVGCEYDTRRLIRMSLDRVDGQLQGACYPLSVEPDADANTFEGPIVCQLAPDGDLYVGNMHDSGWGGGRNTGSIVRLRYTGDLPSGIAEVRARRQGFVIDFSRPIDRNIAARADSYGIESYRRTSTPAYGGEDEQRRVEPVESVQISADARRVTLTLNRLRAGFVYEIRTDNLAGAGDSFFPAEAHYTMRSVPE